MSGDVWSALLVRLFNGARSRPVSRGTWLMREGDLADGLYLVVAGRFHVLQSGTRVAEIGRGEAIGELAFFSGGRRSADVLAARDSEVLFLGEADYQARIADSPDLLHALLRTVATRLVATTDRLGPAEPAPPRNTLVAAAGEAPDPEGLFHRLAASLGRTRRARAIAAADVPADLATDGPRLARWLDAQERRAPLLLLAERGKPVFAEQALRQSDAVLFVAMADGGGGALPASGFEEAATALLGEEAISLVVLRDRARTAIRNTGALLAPRHCRRHFHVALDDEASLERLSRFLAGTATGLVLSGGGAFGAAHVGVYRALKEAGVDIDIVGGTSVGAAIAVAIAGDLPPDEIMARIRTIFIEGRAMGRYTLPFYSVLDHTWFDERLRAHFGDLCLEDLPKPAFAVSASLSGHSGIVTRTGPAFEAVRASSALPGILPPFPSGQHLHVDGAIFDNVPVAAMRAEKRGPNIIVAFAAEEAERALPDYAALPGRLGLLRLYATGGGGRLPSYPGIVNVLTRSLLLSSRAKLKALDFGDDVVVTPEAPPRMGLLDWHRAPELERAGYEAAVAALGDDRAGARRLRGSAGAEAAASEPGGPERTEARV